MIKMTKVMMMTTTTTTTKKKIQIIWNIFRRGFWDFKENTKVEVDVSPNEKVDHDNLRGIWLLDKFARLEIRMLHQVINWLVAFINIYADQFQRVLFRFDLDSVDKVVFSADVNLAAVNFGKSVHGCLWVKG